MVFIAFPVGILGFIICSVLVLCCVPIGIYATIQTLWAWSAIGETRKMMTTLLILLLWWTLPMLAILLLAWSWAIVGILLETAIWVLPPVFIFLGCYWGLRGAAEIRRVERTKPQSSDDITMGELVLVLCVALCSCFLSGSVLFWITLIKSPVLFASIMYNGSSIAIHHIFGLRQQVGAWVVLLFIGFGVAFCLAMPCVGLAIALSWILEVTIATLWPSYVAHYGMPGCRNKRMFLTPTALTDAGKAACQVVALTDILTNTVIRGEWGIFIELLHECDEMRKSERLALSTRVQGLGTIPHFSNVLC